MPTWKTTAPGREADFLDGLIAQTDAADLDELAYRLCAIQLLVAEQWVDRRHEAMSALDQAMVNVWDLKARIKARITRRAMGVGWCGAAILLGVIVGSLYLQGPPPPAKDASTASVHVRYNQATNTIEIDNPPPLLRFNPDTGKFEPETTPITTGDQAVAPAPALPKDTGAPGAPNVAPGTPNQGSEGKRPHFMAMPDGTWKQVQ